jgi:uncharacterized protein YndB with AHSA1/START domain
MVCAPPLDDAEGGDRSASRRGEPDRNGQSRGTEFPNRGVYLEVVLNEKLVFTDAYTSAWVPSQKPFMTVLLTFEDAGAGKTRYTARVRHWTGADREAHETMGFHRGWAKCADQLGQVASKL